MDIEDTTGECSCDGFSSSVECAYKLPKERKKLAGTVPPHQKHVIVFSGTREWPKKVETMKESLGAVLKAASAIRDARVILSDAKGEDAEQSHTALVFPDRILWSGISESNVASWVDVLNGTKKEIPKSLQKKVLGDEEMHVLVCVHASRDKRCGLAGPQIMKTIAQKVERNVMVHGVSHVQGHIYAGNVIVHPPGDWYGYVCLSKVDALVALVNEQRAQPKGVLRELWRGRMGLDSAAQKALLEQWEKEE